MDSNKRKDLSEMSLEELWQLFPVSLHKHKDEWTIWYKEKEAELYSDLKEIKRKRISHIGSTAIGNILAKDIVDIMAEVDKSDFSKAVEILSRRGWLKMSEGDCKASFNQGYTVSGYAEKAYHLHLRCLGDCDELYFRDYLKEHNDIARGYEELKIALSAAYKYNRDAYTSAKSDFVCKYTNIAKLEYCNKYRID